MTAIQPASGTQTDNAVLQEVHLSEDRALFLYDKSPHADALRALANGLVRHFQKNSKGKRKPARVRNCTEAGELLVTCPRNQAMFSISRTYHDGRDHAAIIHGDSNRRIDNAHLRTYARELAGDRQATVYHDRRVRDPAGANPETVNPTVEYDPLLTPFRMLKEIRLDGPKDTTAAKVQDAIRHVILDPHILYLHDPASVRRGLDVLPKKGNLLAAIIDAVQNAFNIEQKETAKQNLETTLDYLAAPEPVGNQRFTEWLAAKYPGRNDTYATVLASAAILAYAARLVAAERRA